MSLQQQESLVCTLCNYTAKTKTNYRNHMYTMRHHKNMEKKQLEIDAQNENDTLNENDTSIGEDVGTLDIDSDSDISNTENDNDTDNDNDYQHTPPTTPYHEQTNERLYNIHEILPPTKILGNDTPYNILFVVGAYAVCISGFLLGSFVYYVDKNSLCECPE